MFKKHLPLIKEAARDRSLLAAWIGFVLASLLVIVTAAFHVVPRNLQLYVHYTSFGVTRFYTDSWYYLIVFVVFGVFLLVANSLVILKLFSAKGRHFAVLFAGLSITVALTSELLLAGLYHLIAINVG